MKPPQVFLVSDVGLQLSKDIPQVATFGGYCLLLRFKAPNLRDEFFSFFSSPIMELIQVLVERAMFLQPFSELLSGILIAGEFFGQAQGKLKGESMAFNLGLYLTGSADFFLGDTGLLIGIFNFFRDTLFFFLRFPDEGFQPLFLQPNTRF